MMRCTPALIAGVLLLGSAASAEATVVKAMSLLEKTEASPVIVHGTVERVETDWEILNDRLKTLITVRVKEAIKGNFRAGDAVIVRRGGGRLGDFEQTAPGLSQYEVGEEVVLFLEPFGAELVAIGIGIGKYEVETRGAEKWVYYDPRVTEVRLSGPKPYRLGPAQGLFPEPLKDFLKRLRTYAKGTQTETLKPGPNEMLRPTIKAPALSR